jgi:hypothetical protein
LGQAGANRSGAQAAEFDAVVVCVGTNNQYDGRGYDRPFELQNLPRVNPRTIVVTPGGGSFDAEPWINRVQGLIQALATGLPSKAQPSQETVFQTAGLRLVYEIAGSC